MARLSQSIDPSAIEPGADFDPIPADTYPAQIIESEVVENKGGTGELLKLTWRVVDDAPQYAGRQFWQNINYLHSSAQAQLIGQQQVKAICEAVGYEGHLDDSEVLHNVPCAVRVSLVPADGQYQAKNEVKSVKPLNAEAPASKPAPAAAKAAPAKAATKAPAKPPAGAGNRPWKQAS